MNGRPRVLVTRALPEAGMNKLFLHCDVTVFSAERQPTAEELKALLPQYDALLCTLMDKIDRELLQTARPKVVSTYAVGYDNIDIAAATEFGIPVTNTPGVLTNATAEIAWALLMAVTRRIVEADHFVRQGKWSGWSPLMLLGTELAGKTLGIIGCGRIGLAVAKRAKAFEMNTLYLNRRRLEEATENEYGLTYADLDTLLGQADFVSLHVPYTPEAHHLINRDALRKMKRSAFLINTARGAVVDEAALVEALQMGEIAGAGLDVFEAEPQVHAGLLPLQNVVLAPHLGSATWETRTKMAEIAVENTIKVLQGEHPISLVNPEVWTTR
ncbi:D-glycerate dehydrogenase [Tumebacillus algifaecis]|uniref:D-glycerate dehydrogenase n=1 Tax=Tumebacillus algifaecis TaxID=1214604 RepID=A0A223D0S7_9BACL|nr:D-glycerate dehydrogenase [Tumebacillus algifaecis]ASS75151.1 D-glycerate dehydrogenase [Tumebacillus algifaecis]